MKWLLLSAIVGMAGTGNSLAAAHYKITDLTPPGATTSRALAINNAGDVIGRASGSVQFLYRDGVFTDLSSVVRNGRVTGMNSHGAIIGAANHDYGHTNYYQAFLLANGTFSWLGVLPGEASSDSAAINASGDIVGASYPKTGTHSHMFLFRNGVMTPLLPDQPYAYPLDINARGQIVGALEDPSGNNRAFLYSDGQLHLLDLLPHFTVQNEALAINNRGEIVGTSYGSGRNAHGYIYANGKMTPIEPPPGSPFDKTYALGINNRGQVVGMFRLNGGPVFLYEKGRTTDLHDLLPRTTRWKLQQPTGINDFGEIVGFGISPSGERHAFLLTPLPAATITGPREIITRQPRRTIHGHSTGRVSRILYRVKPHTPLRTAIGTAAWHFTATLKPGKNRVTVIAVGRAGERSTPAKLTIIRG